MKDELRRRDATGLAELVAAGECTAAELTDWAIQRIERWDPELNTVAARGFEAARDRAKGAMSGPFAGVPFLVKDLLAYPGLPHAFGARVFAGAPAAAGSALSARFDAAGLVVLGKSTTSELGLLGSTETALCGVTKNPWRAGISAMGSSGGSAAAVAAGLVPFAHASDGGGSIRIPASANGLFGFLPGRGRVADNGQPAPVDLVREHCVSRSVRDSARLLEATAVEPIGEMVQERLRIGVYDQTLMGEGPDPEVADALQATAKLCASLGHEVEAAPPPPIDGWAMSDAFFTLCGAMVGQVMAMTSQAIGRPVGPDDFEPFTLELVEWAQGLGEDAVPKAMAACDDLGAQMRAFLETYDVVLCPTIPVVPWALGTLAPDLGRAELIRRTERLAGYTAIHNVAGGPAMSVPLGTSPDGLPIGSHFAAAPGQEARLLGLAYQLEEAAPWAGRLPLR